MRWRRPLAVSAAVLVAVLGTLALTTRSGRTATAPAPLVPITLTPNCGPAGLALRVHVYGTGFKPNEVYPLDAFLYGSNARATTITRFRVPANGVVDLDVDFPAFAAGTYVIYLEASPNRGAAFFTVGCPTISAQPSCGPADDGSGARYSLNISGTGFGQPPRTGTTAGSDAGPYLPVHVELDGVEVPGSPTQVDNDGSIAVTLTPGRVKAGAHTLHAFQTTGDVYGGTPLVANVRDATTAFTVPCAGTTTTAPTTPTTQSTPTTAPTTAPTTPTTAPTTKTTQTKTTKTTQTTTTPTTPATVGIAPSCLEPSATANASTRVTAAGFAPGAVDVLLDGNVATKAAADANGNVSAEVELTPGTADHAIEVRQGSRQADATLRVPCASHPKLRVDPPLGPPGLVTKATGSGFPPNVDIVLGWQPGIGRWTVHTSAEGTFETSVLIFPQDQTGERVLRATPVSRGRFDKVDAKFLCVPGSVQQPRTFDFRR